MVNKSKSVWAGWLDISAGIIWLLGDAFLFLIIIGLSVGFGAPHVFNILMILAIPALASILAILGGVVFTKTDKLGACNNRFDLRRAFRTVYNSDCADLTIEKRV